jgi:hypothetical protein
MAVAKRGSAKIITPGRRLQQMGAGARAHDEEEGVLDLAVHPDDAGKPAEHLALAALPQDLSARQLERGAHARAASRRAMRSFKRNCAALMT